MPDLERIFDPAPPSTPDSASYGMSPPPGAPQGLPLGTTLLGRPVGIPDMTGMPDEAAVDALMAVLKSIVANVAEERQLVEQRVIENMTASDNRLAAVQHEVLIKEETVNKLQSDVAAREHDLEKLQQVYTTVRTQSESKLVELQTELDDARSKCEIMRDQRGDALTRCKTAEGKLEQSMQELSKAIERRDTWDQRLADQQREVAIARDAKAVALRDKLTAETKLASSVEATQRAMSALADITTNSDVLLKERDAALLAVVAASNRVTEAEKALTDGHQAWKAAERALQADIDSKDASHARCVADYNDMMDRMEATQNKLIDCEAELVHLKLEAAAGEFGRSSGTATRDEVVALQAALNVEKADRKALAEKAEEIRERCHQLSERTAAAHAARIKAEGACIKAEGAFVELEVATEHRCKQLNDRIAAANGARLKAEDAFTALELTVSQRVDEARETSDAEYGELLADAERETALLREKSDALKDRLRVLDPRATEPRKHSKGKLLFPPRTGRSDPTPTTRGRSQSPFAGETEDEGERTDTHQDLASQRPGQPVDLQEMVAQEVRSQAAKAEREELAKGLRSKRNPSPQRDDVSEVESSVSRREDKAESAKHHAETSINSPGWAAKMTAKWSTTILARDVARLMSTKHDPTHKKWRNLMFYCDRVAGKHAYARTFPAGRDKRADDNLKRLERLDFSGLQYGDVDEIGDTWNELRRKWQAAVQPCLAAACDLMDILSALQLVAENSKSGNPMVAAQVAKVMDHTNLHQDDILTMEVLGLFLDNAFGDASRKWNKDALAKSGTMPTTRLAAEDPITLAERVVAAYVAAEQTIDPSVNATNYYKFARHLGLVKEAYVLCLQHDEIPERGEYAFDAFISEYDRRMLTIEMEAARGAAKLEGDKKEAYVMCEIVTISQWLRLGENPKRSKWQVPAVAPAPKGKQRANDRRTRVAATQQRDEALEFDEYEEAEMQSTQGVNATQAASTSYHYRMPPLPGAVNAVQPGGRGGKGQGDRGGGQGKGGRGGGRGGDSHNAEQPPGATDRRVVSPPTGSTGHPDNKAWTPEDWRNTLVYITKWQKFKEDLAGDWDQSALKRALAFCRPCDAQASAPGLIPMRRQGSSYPNDACLYCLHTKKAPSGSPEASLSHPDNWQYGTGNGAHPSLTCQPFARFVAEGGHPQFRDKCKEHIRVALHIQTPEERKQFMEHRKSFSGN